MVRSNALGDAPRRAARVRAMSDSESAALAAAKMVPDLPDASALLRSHSVLTVRAVDEEQRIITGTATTPSPDRYGDVVEPMGLKFANPLPLLWMHKSDQPVGWATFEAPTATGVTFTAKLPKIPEPGELQECVDKAWQAVKTKLVRGVSIGFRPLEYSFMDDGGIRFIESEVLELSLVTIPANSDATIATIRSIDAEARAASGNARQASPNPPPGAPGIRNRPVVRAIQVAKKTIAEQISAMEATRQAKAARILEIQSAAADDGRTKSAEEQEEFDNLSSEIEAVDRELVDLRRVEKMNLSTATVIRDVTDQHAGTVLRSVPATVRAAPKAEKGIGFTRFVLAVARSKGNLMQALEIAKANDQWKAETPDVEVVLRAAVAAGTTSDTTWASPLVQYQNLAGEFIEYLRPLTIMGKLPVRNVPFKVKIPRQTGTSTAGWVGEGQAKPVSALAFDSITLDIATISDIVIITQQLARYSAPNAEMLVRDDLAMRIANFMDAQFVDPTVSSTGSSPASITYGVSATIATGTTTDALRTDVGTLMQTFLEANLQLNSPYWIMSQVTAAKIGLIRNSLGVKEYPELNAQGGFFEGIPVIASQSVPATDGSPTDGYPIILVNAGDIIVADEGQVRIDASSEASLQMDSAPDSPTLGTTSLMSLWQQGMLGIKADRDVNWAKRRSTAVQYISNAKYTT